MKGSINGKTLNNVAENLANARVSTAIFGTLTAVPSR